MSGRLICLLVGGDLYRIWAGGKEYLFEMHSYCGPMPLRARDHEPRLLGPRHPFWTAVTLWDRQGRRTKPCQEHADQSWAVYDNVPLPTWKPPRPRNRRRRS